MYSKLLSRKLLAFIGMTLLVVLNFVFDWGMPASDVLYLVILAASYILGQGYVDASNNPAKGFPFDDFANSVSNIIRAEMNKTGYGKNIPLEHIIDIIKTTHAKMSDEGTDKK